MEMDGTWPLTLCVTRRNSHVIFQGRTLNCILGPLLTCLSDRCRPLIPPSFRLFPSFPPDLAACCTSTIIRHSSAGVPTIVPAYPYCPSAAMSKIYSQSDVASHNKSDSLWIVVDGDVYDLTKFQDDHPGV
jgi:hypothetical protein